MLPNETLEYMLNNYEENQFRAEPETLNFWFTFLSLIQKNSKV